MTSDELRVKLRDLKNELMNLRFQHSINQLENPLKMVEIKKNIARIMTILTEKEHKN